MNIQTRNRLEHWAYQHLAKPIFFRQDPEAVHDRVSRIGEYLGNHQFSRQLTAKLFSYADPLLEQELAGIRFPNPIGLAAGFDKNAHLVEILPTIGFGFAEIGSVSARPCPGNPKPRLFRLPESKSILVNYDLASDGCSLVAQRLSHRKPSPFPLGISLAPTNDSETAELGAAITDYLTSYRALAPFADYLTLNLSCPNTQSSQPFNDPKALSQLLTELVKEPVVKPLFLKLSPDSSPLQLEAITETALNYHVSGIICSNLTKNGRGKGGLSGQSVAKLADHAIALVAKRSSGRLVIVGCGGIFSAADAYRKIGLGASLIQLASSLIYEGPSVVSSISYGLSQLLRRDGFSSLSQACGKNL